MIRVLATAVLVLALGLAVQWGRQGHQKAQEATQLAESRATQLADEKAAHAASNKTAARVEATLSKQVLAERALATEAKEQAKELAHALKDNPGWAATPVPDGVWDALYPPAPASP